MKSAQISLLVLAAIFFTIGGFVLHHIYYFMWATIVPFVVAVVFVSLAVNISDDVLQNFDKRTVYFVISQTFSRKGHILHVKNMSTNEWRVAKIGTYPPPGFIEKHSWGTWLVPVDIELDEETATTLALYGGTN